MFAYLPFTILTAASIMTVNLLKERQKRIRARFMNFHENLNTDRVKKRIVGAAFWSMIVSFPSATTRLFYSDLILTEPGRLALQITDSWIFTLHGMNFFLLIASNSLFKSEAIKIFRLHNSGSNQITPVS